MFDKIGELDHQQCAFSIGTQAPSHHLLIVMADIVHESYNHENLKSIFQAARSADDYDILRLHAP